MISTIENTNNGSDGEVVMGVIGYTKQHTQMQFKIGQKLSLTSTSDNGIPKEFGQELFEPDLGRSHARSRDVGSASDVCCTRASVG